MTDHPGSATVPTPGFLTPSPVSWLRSSSRVCCAPLPSLGSSPFRAFPSRQVAHPSSGPLSPLPFFPVEPRCGARGLVTSGLHRLGRRSGVVPGRILPEARGSLSASLLAPPTLRQLARLAAPPGHPGPRTPDPPRSGRSVDFGAFFPARVRSHRSTVTRRAEAGALLGVLAPPEPCSRQAWGPHFTRHGRRRPSSRWHRAPLGASRDPVDPRACGHFSWLAPRALRCWEPSTSGGIVRR